MSTRCQVLVKKVSKNGYDRTGVCPRYGKKFFHVHTDGSYNKDAIVGICELHLNTHGDPMAWKVGRWEVNSIRYMTGKVKSYEEVTFTDLKTQQRNIHHEAIKDRLKVLFSYKHSRKVSREDWQRLFQEALDEYCVEEVQDA